MKYLKYSFVIMIGCIALTMISGYAKDLGFASIVNVKIDFLGSYKTSLHSKETNSPQYAQKLSCNGTVLGLDTDVLARADRYSVKEGVWTKITSSNTELKGDTQVADSKYVLYLKSSGTVESCYFVGNWTYN